MINAVVDIKPCFPKTKKYFIYEYSLLPTRSQEPISLTWFNMEMNDLKTPSLKDNSMNIHVVYIQTFQWFLGIYVGFFLHILTMKAILNF